MESVSVDTSPSKYKVGDLVIVTSPGQWFGKVGEIVSRAHDSVRHRLDWWIEFTVGHEGAGFNEHELMARPAR